MRIRFTIEITRTPNRNQIQFPKRMSQFWISDEEIRQSEREEVTRTLAAALPALLDHVAAGILDAEILCPVHGASDCLPETNGCDRILAISADRSNIAQVIRGPSLSWKEKGVTERL